MEASQGYLVVYPTHVLDGALMLNATNSPPIECQRSASLPI
jgi:hypothetical protein